ncbi:extracellular solute-binding protein [Paenibacillus alba]|uniref:extracellular solute-binding protein n=1 Tax=Paenibacillus alba TaxID=1197127 RepID=UPI001566C00C|nr:extracellular solute-binding protein [Paenibacillus alba]NQX67308.1 extracellular solute-binding protein [Paenibacillus alba]
MKMKSISVSLMGVMVTFGLLTGCSQQNTKKEASASPAVTNAQTAATKELTGELEIQYFVGGYGDAWWKQSIDEFQKLNPKLKITQTAGPQINEQMKPRWIQGNPPDLMFINGAGSNARQMFIDNQLMDLTDWLKDAKNADGEKILDVLFSKPEEYQPGKTYTLPLVFGSYGTFYDKAELRKNGWDEPKDWPSFMDTMQKVKDSGKMAPYIHTGVYPQYIIGGLLNSAIVAANGSDPAIINKINALETGVFKSEPVMKALDKLIELNTKGFIEGSSAALNHTDSQMQFLQHKAAFIPNGLWIENEMKKDIPAGFEFGFIPSVVQDKAGKSIVIPSTATMGIAKKAKNPDAAKAYLQYVFTKKQALAWAELTGSVLNVKADLSKADKVSALVKQASTYFASSDVIIAPIPVLPEELFKIEKDATLALVTGKINKEEWAKRLEDGAAKQREKNK